MDKAYRVGIEHSVLGCTEEQGWGSLNSEQSTLSPGHLTGGLRVQQHRKMSSVSISSFLIYQGENSGDRVGVVASYFMNLPTFALLCHERKE